MRRLRPLPLLALAIASVAGTARADDASDVDLRTFRPAPDRRATLATEGVETPGAWNLQFAQWFVFETASLRVREPGAEGPRRIVGPRLIAEPAVALGLGRIASIGVTLPYVVYQGTEASSLTDGQPAPSQGIGDLAIRGKATVISPDPDAGGLGLALLTRFQLPTGDRSSFVSDRGVIFDGDALVSYDYAHVLVGTALVGYRARSVHHPFTTVTIGDTIPWGATISLRPQGLGLDPGGHWTFSVEAHGEVGAVPNALFASSRVSPAFAGASTRYEINRDLSFVLGVEGSLSEAIGAPAFRSVFSITYAPTIVDEDHDGVPDDVDECPGLPEDGQGAKPHDGCPDYEGEETSDIPPLPEPEPEVTMPEPPKVIDTDGDGILDDADKCPDQPETQNGYEDEDGCPEIDTDGDTFLDAVDHCPNEAETWNGFEDDDGCPDEAPKKGPKVAPAIAEQIGKTGTTLVPGKAIAFEGDAPAKESTSALRAVAAWLLAHPGARVRVAVKPEGKGDDAAKLAAARAAAVVEALVRYAHTGDVAEATAWDPKLSPAKANVAFVVVPAPPPEAAPAPPAAPAPAPAPAPNTPAPAPAP